MRVRKKNIRQCYKTQGLMGDEKSLVAAQASPVSPFFGAVVLLGAVVFFGAVVYVGAVV